MSHPGNAPDDPPDAAPLPDPSPKRIWWWQRPTVSKLLRDIGTRSDFAIERDQERNVEARLPDDESVHLGGLTLVEAFTPSTVSNLYDALRKWPRPAGRPDDDWVSDLERSRTGSRGGWTSLGLVRPPGHSILGTGFNDPDLPSGIQAVWLSLDYLTPSVAVVSATFTFEESAADLSDVLRADFPTSMEKVRIAVDGRFGKIRAHIPWGRPKHYRTSANVWDGSRSKRRAVEQRIEAVQAECARWFFGKFRGRFASADVDERPSIRLIFTDTNLPFEGREPWRESAGLAWTPYVFRCTDDPGWALSAGIWPSAQDRPVWTFAARRSDLGHEDKSDMTGRSNWSLTQRFGSDQSSLVARCALIALLDIYAGCLARLRDAARRARGPGRPVRDARNLDVYLLTDGLDAATVSTDVAILTADVEIFRWGVPEYTEDQGIASLRPKRLGPAQKFVPGICENLRQKAVRLKEDTANTDGNLRASAELRQAIANTRLQRTVVVFTVAALVVAVVSLLHT